ncbi:hypothetical protein [Spirillospora sp. NPDC048819]|uniref:hypothetical protein n=1 Tax=Spirillospora sp. NPDC048819 TaxID=3155268 RepID=UPI0034006FE1
MTADQTIVCAGTLSAITCHSVDSLVLHGYGEHADTTTLLGNDAVIAARLLHTSGEPVSCLLIDPTEADVDALRKAAPGLRVRATGRRSGPVTRSAVLQTSDGQRYWLLPPIPTTPGPLSVEPDTARTLLYVDLYDEVEEAVFTWLAASTPSRLTVNLSGSRRDTKAARLAPLRPLLVQASLPYAASPAALQGAAHKLRSMAYATYAVVSAGPRGFTLTGPDGTWHRTPGRIITGPALGAGAALSAGLLAGLAHGASGADLVDTANNRVTAHLCEKTGGAS